MSRQQLGYFRESQGDDDDNAFPGPHNRESVSSSILEDVGEDDEEGCAPEPSNAKPST